jgi:MFS family permease
MRRLLYPFFALLLSLGILLTGVGLLGTLLAVRMGVEGFPTQVIGLVMASYSVGDVLATLLVDKVIRKVGHIRTFAALSAIAAGSTLLYPLLVHPVMWASMRAVLGFCLAGLYMLTESWLNDRTPRDYRSQVLAFYSITTYAALGGGQFLLNLWDITGFQLFSLAALLFALALVPVALTQAPSPQIIEAHPVSLRRLHEISPLGLVGSTCAGLMAGGFMAMGPVFAQGAGFSLTEVSGLMAATILGGLLLQWPIGRLADVYDRRWIIFWVAVGVGILSALIALSAETLPLAVLALSVLWGGLAFTVYPLALAVANDFIRPEELIGAAAGLLMVNGVGMIVGPVAFGWLMVVLGPAGLYWGIALVAALLALFAYYRHQVGEPLLVEEQTEFVTVPIASSAFTAALDPRGEEHQLEFEFEFHDEPGLPEEIGLAPDERPPES